MDSLLQYSDSGSDNEEQSNKEVEQRLPLPNFLIQNSNKNYNQKEINHEGKVRNFPHEPGNWATYIYLPLEPPFEFSNYLEALIAFFKPLNLKLVDDFHISLTRTVILRHHWIPDFIESVKKNLSNINHFKIHLFSLKTYTNEERTRSFLALKVDQGEEAVKIVVTQLDMCLRDYNLQSFYKDPSFHLSLLWCPGDKCDDINKLIHLLPLRVKNFGFSKIVSSCICATGNKRFSFNFLQ